MSISPPIPSDLPPSSRYAAHFENPAPKISCTESLGEVDSLDHSLDRLGWAPPCYRVVISKYPTSQPQLLLCRVHRCCFVPLALDGIVSYQSPCAPGEEKGLFLFQGLANFSAVSSSARKWWSCLPHCSKGKLTSLATAGADFEPVQATMALLIVPFQHFMCMIPVLPRKRRLEAGWKQSWRGTSTTLGMGLCSCMPIPRVSEPACAALACPEAGLMVHRGEASGTAKGA